MMCMKSFANQSKNLASLNLKQSSSQLYELLEPFITSWALILPMFFLFNNVFYPRSMIYKAI